MKKVILQLFALTLLSHVIHSQDINFSQYHYTPHEVNPAAIASDNNMAVYIDYRSQKLNNDINYKTVSFFGKYPLFDSKGRRIAAVGLGFINDKSDGINVLKYNGISSMFAYNFYLGDKWILSPGVGAAYSQKQFALEGYSTGSQWVDNVGFVPDASTGESFDNLTTRFFSVNGGLQLYQHDGAGKVKHYIGLSLFHVNQPDESFLDNNSIRQIRYSAQAGIRVYQTEKYAVTPEVIFNQQAENSYLGLGAAFSYFIKNDNPYDPIENGSVDLRVRNIVDEGLVFGIELNQPNFSIGFSYDVALSSSGTLDPGNNATEFAIAIKKRIESKNKKPVKVVSNYSIGEIRNFYDENRGDGQMGQADSGQEGSSGNSGNHGDFQFELKREFNFGFNDATLDQEDKRYLNDLVNLMKFNTDLRLEIIGHADNIGTEGANRKISENRANAVEQYLIEQGIPKNRLKTRGMGSKAPLFPNDTEENRAKNRRVEFTIYKDLK